MLRKPPNRLITTDADRQDSKAALSTSESSPTTSGTLSGFIDRGTTVNGSHNFNAMMRVDGHLVGECVSSINGTLIVGRDGQIEADINVAVAIIHGTVIGDVKARKRLELGRSSRIVGHVECPSVIAEEGAALSGNCTASTTAQKVVAQDNKSRNRSSVQTTPRRKPPVRKLRVFLCHAKDDKHLVRDLHKRLIDIKVDVWFDEEKLLPGQNWELEIDKAVRQSDVIIVCLSKRSTNKRGFVQKEIKQALDVAAEQPEDSIFIVPLRVENCLVPDRLRRQQWVDFFDQGGFTRLANSLNRRALELGLRRPQTINKTGFEGPTIL